MIRLDPSWSWSFLAHSKLSISSIKTTEGWCIAAIANIVLTIFSPSPTHLLVKVDAEIDKNVDFDYAAIAFPSKVLPVPGGPKNITPLGGALIPVKISGLSIGHIIISWMIFLAFSNPAISSHFTLGYFSIISFSISSTILGSKFLYLSSSIKFWLHSLSLLLSCFNICYWTDRPGLKLPPSLLVGATNFLFPRPGCRPELLMNFSDALVGSSS